MSKFINKQSRIKGLSPETLFSKEEKTEKVRITIIDYDEAKFQEKDVETVEECFPFKDTPTVTWVNIESIAKPDIIEKIGKHFDMHPLILEGIASTGQRPKYEDFDNYIFIILKMLSYNDKNNDVEVEQVSLIFGKNYVISFQETPGDVFGPVRERIKNTKWRIRKMGTDYLAYSLIDAIVDNYFLIMEKLGERIEVIGEELILNPKPSVLQEMHDLKRNMIFLRKSVWPLREVINVMLRGESGLIQKVTSIYLRDVYEHTIQVIDTIETFRDMMSGMLEIYLSSISNKMNEIMKVLTIIATIFIPLTFIVGIYGMNFNTTRSPWNMPELNWRYGYCFAWGIMLSIAVIMIVYFKRKKWL